jgi:glucose-6-phosphate isomerase
VRFFRAPPKEIINQTENRAVLHTALRAKESAVVYVNGKNIVPMFMM